MLRHFRKLGAKCSQSSRGFGRLGFADHAADFIQPRLGERVPIEGGHTGQQFIKQNAQGIDV